MHTPRRSILATIALIAFACFASTAHATETPPGSQPEQQQQQQQQQKPAPAAEKPAARREDTEPKTLTEAITLLKSARADRDLAESTLATEEASHAKTRELAQNAINAGNTFKAERDQARADLATMTGQHAAEVKEHGKTKGLLALAEGAAGILGVSRTDAVQVERPAAAATTMAFADFEKLSHDAREAFMAKGGKLTN